MTSRSRRRLRPPRRIRRPDRCGASSTKWLDLFAAECRYQIVPRENFDRGLPAALVFCDSRAMLEDRIRALREANKYNIHTDRHVIGPAAHRR